MSRRVSASVKAIEFFRTAPLEVAEELYQVVGAELRSRRPKVTRVKSTKRKARTNAVPGVSQDIRDAG